MCGWGWINLNWLLPQRAWLLTELFLCRLENGLNKLHKTQSEVDVLIEDARAMALEVEQKVANANIFAEQVSPDCSALLLRWPL